MGRPSFFPLASYCIWCIPGTEEKGADHRLWRSAPTGLQTARASSVDCQSCRARRRTGPTTCTGNSWLTAGAAAKRRLLLQCGFSRSAVKGISSMNLTSGTPPRAPRRRRGNGMTPEAAEGVDGWPWSGSQQCPWLSRARWPRRAKSPRPHRCSYRCLEANPRNYRLPQNCNRHTDGGENGAVAFA